MRRFIIFIMLFITVQFNLIGQKYSSISNNEFTLIVNRQLSKSNAKKIKDLDKDEDKAQDYLIESDIYFEKFHEVKSELQDMEKGSKRAKLLEKLEKYEREALGNKVDGLIKYCETYSKKYYIYSNDVQKLLAEADKNNIDTLKKLEQLAASCFKKADLNVQLAYHTAGVDNAFRLTNEADRIEQLGLLYIMKMYSFLLKFEHIKIDEKISILKSREKSTNENNGNNESLKDSVNIKTVVVYDTVKVEDSNREIVTKKTKDVVFKIQIAASKKPLSIEVLSNICKSHETIYSEYDDKWYKYYIGFYETYQLAQENKITTGVKGAFIVGYKNGKRMNVNNFKQYVSKNLQVKQ